MVVEVVVVEFVVVEVVVVVVVVVIRMVLPVLRWNCGPTVVPKISKALPTARLRIIAIFGLLAAF